MRIPPQRSLVHLLGPAAALLLANGVLSFTRHPWLLPSLGGSCVILFGMARGIMAQPRSFLGGHLIATCTGLVFHLGYQAFGGPLAPWIAFAVGAALALMALTRTIHSPAGANPVVVFAEDADWSFLISPLIPGLAVLFLVAFALNNMPRPWGAGPWPRFLGTRLHASLGRTSREEPR